MMLFLPAAGHAAAGACLRAGLPAAAAAAAAKEFSKLVIKCSHAVSKLSSTWSRQRRTLLGCCCWRLRTAAAAAGEVIRLKSGCLRSCWRLIVWRLLKVLLLLLRLFVLKLLLKVLHRRSCCCSRSRRAARC
jgi:hypothetical protein